MSAATEHAHLHHRPHAMHFYCLFQNAKVCCDVPVQATADDLVDASPLTGCAAPSRRLGMAFPALLQVFCETLAAGMSELAAKCKMKVHALRQPFGLCTD